MTIPDTSNPITDSTNRQDGAATGDSRLAHAAVAAAILLLLALFGPLLQGQVYTCHDVLSLHLPARAFVQASYAQGHSPLWFPGYYCGFYLHGSGEAAIAHPLQQILYRFLPLSTAFNLELLLGYPLAFAGMLLLLKRLRLTTPCALFGALGFTFSGWMFLHIVHMQAILIAAHIPWALLCVDSLARSNTRRETLSALAGLALLTGSQLLLGHPQYVIYSWFAEIAFALYLLLSTRSKKWLLWLLAAKILGGGIGMAQLLPMWESGQLSDRDAPTLEYRLSYSLHPANLAQPVAPYLFRDRNFPERTKSFGLTGNAHEFTLYTGAAGTVLLIWLLFRLPALPGDRRRLAIATLLLALLSLLLAMGRYGGVYYLQTQLPVISLFRVPSRYLILYHLAATVAAALALEDLVRVSQRKEKSWREALPLWIPFAASLLVTGAGLLLRNGDSTLWAERIKPDTLRDNLLIAYGPCAMLAAALLLTLALRRKRFALPLLALFFCADMGLYGLSYARTPQPARIDTILAEYPAPPEGDFRVESVRLIDNLWTMRGARLTHGYVQLDPRRKLAYRGGQSINALRVAGVAWRQDPSSHPAGPEGHEPPPAPKWIAVPDPLPRARLLSRVQVSADPGTEIDAIDPAAVALVGKDIDLPESTPGTVKIYEDVPGRVTLHAACPARQLLVLSERIHPGWTLVIDGAPETIEPVYGDFLGCTLEAGEHDVVFRFAPASYHKGLRVTLAAACLALLCGAGGLVPGTRRD